MWLVASGSLQKLPTTANELISRKEEHSKTKQALSRNAASREVMLPPSPASSILSLHKIQLQVPTSSTLNALSCTKQQGTRAPELPHLLPLPPLCTSVHPNFQDTNLMKINGYPPNTAYAISGKEASRHFHIQGAFFSPP